MTNDAAPTRQATAPRMTLEDAFDPHRITITKTTEVAQVGTIVKRRLQELGWVHLWAVGPNAVNQAVKAMCMARRYLRDEGMSLVVVPTFGFVADRRDDDEARHGIRFTVRRVADDLHDD